MARLFGTDGIRGVAGRDLTAERAFHLGESAGMLIDENGWDRKVIIGGDSRISGPMLESALASGLMSKGVDVHLAGIAPTPAIAFLTKHMGFPLGCVISASHNPIEDNGIKFFDSRGMKVNDEVEDRLEELLEKKPSKKNMVTGQVTGEKIGRRHDAKSAIEQYVRFLHEIVLDRIQGLSVVVDGAFGAASAIAPAIFSILGTRVVPFNCQPDGSRINVRCGATHPEGLQAKVREMKADIGIALDGDADRAILVDEKGGVIDGDQVLAMWGRHLLRKKALPSNTVVGTVLSNKGLEVALEEKGGKLLRAPVGDKFVLREMLKSGAIIGGEQSGHLIFLDHHTTGDGILTGLMVAVLMRDTNKLLSELGREMSRFPQVQLNIEVKDKKSALDDEKITAGVKALSKEIEKINGRLLVRPSGTESVIRVMTEAPDVVVARRMAEEAIELFKRIFGIRKNYRDIENPDYLEVIGTDKAMKVLTPTEMRAVDYRAISEMGIPSLKLMENAGRAVADWVLDHLADMDPVVVLAGRGNNGGDGLVAARDLSESGRQVEVILLREGKSLSEDCQANLDRLPAVIPVLTIDDEDDLKSAVLHLKNINAKVGPSKLDLSPVFIDSLLGTGVTGEVTGLIADLLQAAFGMNWPTVAVDIPSGIDGTDGSYLGAAIPAIATITMGLPKTGLYIKAGVEYSGEVVVVDIGFPPEAEAPAVPTMMTIEGSTIGKLFADDRCRPDEVGLHKGDFGRILVVAGSRGMLGANELVSRAALRAGCGMVVAAVPITEYAILAARTGPEIMTAPVAAEEHFGCFAPEGIDDLTRWIRWADVLALGPGLSKNQPAMEFARNLVKAFPDKADRQIIIDADGLKAFANDPGLLSDRARAPILTPHQGEFAELTEPHDLPDDLFGRLTGYSALCDCVVILKGARTLIANPRASKGSPISVNVESGNPGMATAGSGDVLTGILAGLAGQPTIAWDPFQIACTGVYLHGLAGDLAASWLSRQALIAGDIIEALPRAFKSFSRTKKSASRKTWGRRRI